MSAPRYRAFKISTRCCIPTEMSSTLASGSMARPYFSEISTTFFRAVAMSSLTPFTGSMPRTMFSVMVNGCTSIKCWCTMPMPTSMAFLGLSMSTGLPLTRISPELGLYRPYRMFISVLFPAPFSPRIAWISPLCTVRSIPSLAVKSPNFFTIFRISMTGVDRSTLRCFAKKLPPYWFCVYSQTVSANGFR